MKTLRYLFSLVIVTLLAACGGGGGGGGTPTRSVTLNLAVSLTDLAVPASDNLKGIGVKITLPSGVTPSLNGGLVAASVVTPLVAGTADPQFMTYTPATATVPGTLSFTLYATGGAGFASPSVGQPVVAFATVVFNQAGTTTLVAGDFPLSNPVFYDSSISSTPGVLGVKAEVTSVSF